MQQKKLYIGNLPYSADESQLNDLFAPYGDIDEVILIKDRDSGRSKGFAFVTFATGEAAEKALEQDGKELDGRPLKVNPAQERNDRGGKRGGFSGGQPGRRRGGFGSGKRGDRKDRNRW